MSQFEYKQFYSRNRPHIHPPDSILFVTFRLAGSIPKAIVQKYNAERELRDRQLRAFEAELKKGSIEKTFRDVMAEYHRNWFKRYDEILDKAASGPMWLGEEQIRRIVFDKLVADDDVKYRLDAFSIMSNHVHVVFKPKLGEKNLTEIRTPRGMRFETHEHTLSEILQSMKGVAARKCNQILNRTGSFWEKESFDHVVRREDGFFRAIRYALNNPVKARLVANWLEWPGNYRAPRLREHPMLTL